MPNVEDRFYVSHLDPALKDDFLALYKSVKAFEPVCRLPDRITPDQADLLVTVLRFDCPELFQIDVSSGYTISTLNDKVVEIALPYIVEKAEYEEEYRECSDVVSNIVRQTEGLTDLEKERYVYDFLTESITYTIDRTHCADAYGALVEHQAKCDGISIAMKWIMEGCGITTLVISGRQYGDEFGHAWNCLNIDGSYYDLDITNDTRTSDGSRTMNLYGAYNIYREWISSVYPVSEVLGNNFTLPETQKGQSYHELNGSFVSGGSDINKSTWQALDHAYESGGLCFLQFESSADYRKFLDNYETYTRSWFESRNVGGAFDMNAIDEFRTAALHIRASN
ncbi:MAG: hypothetical protein IJT43_04325 [Stomatobaculum sp.]|nr:hypothetical protein [Stomatobaculum sp.]